MNRGTVYYRDIPAGTLERSTAGYVFRYDDAYRANPSLPDISDCGDGALVTPPDAVGRHSFSSTVAREKFHTPDVRHVSITFTSES